MRITQKLPRSLNTFVKHILMRCFARTLLECLGKVEKVQARNSCQFFQFEVIAEMRLDVLDYPAQERPRETAAIRFESCFSGRIVLRNVCGERHRNRFAEERSARRTCRYVGAQ